MKLGKLPNDYNYKDFVGGMKESTRYKNKDMKTIRWVDEDLVVIKEHVVSNKTSTVYLAVSNHDREYLWKAINIIADMGLVPVWYEGGDYDPNISDSCDYMIVVINNYIVGKGVYTEVERFRSYNKHVIALDSCELCDTHASLDDFYWEGWDENERTYKEYDYMCYNLANSIPIEKYFSEATKAYIQASIAEQDTRKVDTNTEDYTMILFI